MADATRSVYPALIPVAEELRGPRVTLLRHRASDAAGLFAALEASRARLIPWLRTPDALQTIKATRDWLIHREAGWLLREILSFTKPVCVTAPWASSRRTPFPHICG